jgi:hypothetical protein
MTDSIFKAKNGLQVSNTLIYATAGQVGVNTITPDANLAVIGTANVSGNVYIGGNITGAGYANIATSVNSAILSVGTSFIANTTGAYHTGVVNAATIQASATFTANATLVNAAAINVVNQTNTATLYVTTSANVGTYLTANSTVVNAIALTTANLNVSTNTFTIGQLSSVANGNIGISNTTPADKLAINGTTNFIGNSTISGNQVRTGRLVEGMTNNATASGTVTLDLSTRNVFNLTLTGNTTIAFSNPPSAGNAQMITIITRQDATGSRTLTWPASVKWSYSQNPVIATTPNYADVFTLMTIDGGTTYAGAYSMANTAI